MADDTKRATLQDAKASYVDCNHGLTDSDKTDLAKYWALLTAGVAAYNTGQAVNYVLKQYELAKFYFRVAKWWLDYHKTYFRPVEDQELAETMALEEPSPLYDQAVGRSQAAGHIRFKNAANKAVQCTSEYCTGLRGQLLRDTMAQEATAAAALAQMGYRNERAYVESRSDVRWKRMLATAARGREMQANAVSSAQLAFGIYGDLGTQAGKAAAGAATMAGYYWHRNDTIYPTLLRGEVPGAPSDKPPAQQVLPPDNSTSGVILTGDSRRAATSADPGWTD